uniref:FBA_2 domain-containing protein n=2 Tax=Caenorhabditis tropicalis TaxID=1561998 RepID=A0A1I7UDT1_9PELO
MNSKPLTYDSLKTVLLYMDPNTRILLSSRAPSIHATEKTVPLKLEELKIGRHLIRVNGIFYKYGVYQVDQRGKLPYQVSGSSKINFKWTCDVDEFGIPDYITRDGGMLPGNNGRRELTLFGEYDAEIIPTNEGRLKKLKKKLAVAKREDKQMSNRNSDKLRSRMTRSEKLRIERIVKEESEYRKNGIERMENELLPFENKRKNKRPKFEIHVTKKKGDSLSQVIERIKYTGDLHKAGKSLFEFMFGKRLFLIEVKELTLLQGCSTPSDFKMRIKHLDFSDDGPLELEQFKPIIHESSFPLEKLTIHKNYNAEKAMNHEIIVNSKLLQLDGIVTLSHPFLQNLQNQKVHASIKELDFFKSEVFISLIRSWVETNKPNGTCFTFSFWGCELKEKYCKEALTLIREQIDGAMRGNKCVNIPMRTSTKLKISYRRYENNDHLIEMAVVPS